MCESCLSYSAHVQLRAPGTTDKNGTPSQKKEQTNISPSVLSFQLKNKSDTLSNTIDMENKKWYQQCTDRYFYALLLRIIEQVGMKKKNQVAQVW